ncbi:MAG: hypothetical protein KatS3mg115_2362 [Candidatus Poribacteria bacterium]|nr:MAG: hypothetical protein KatS3mg115_2362 [Candidatus Poribacteria bacterium]
MVFHVLACEVFQREFLALEPEVPSRLIWHFQPFGLHNTPEKLAGHLQGVIDSIRGGDAILIGYGLCSRGTAGLTARRIPLVIPRAHDCITVFLGSKERYAREFQEHPGTYYYSPGWVAHHRQSGGPLDLNSPQAKARLEAKFAEYVHKYGEENARYLIEVETQWLQHYSRLAYIETGVGTEADRRFVRELTVLNHWEYVELPGDLSLMRRFLSGQWDPVDFLVVPPGYRIQETLDERVVTAVPAEEGRLNDAQKDRVDAAGEDSSRAEP